MPIEIHEGFLALLRVEQGNRIMEGGDSLDVFVCWQDEQRIRGMENIEGVPDGLILNQAARRKPCGLFKPICEPPRNPPVDLSAKA